MMRGLNCPRLGARTIAKSEAEQERDTRTVGRAITQGATGVAQSCEVPAQSKGAKSRAKTTVNCILSILSIKYKENREENAAVAAVALGYTTGGYPQMQSI